MKTITWQCRGLRKLAPLAIVFFAPVLNTDRTFAQQKPAPTTALAIVTDGKARSVIVTADRPSRAAATGASILAGHLKQMSGAVVPVIQEGKLRDVRVEGGRIVSTDEKFAADTYILVGQSQLTQKLGVTDEGLGPAGIRLLTRGNEVVLLGADDRTPIDTNGTLYAVTTFLEEIGVRYLWPGEAGKVIPSRRDIAVGALDRSYTPQIQQRRIRSVSYQPRIQVGLDMIGATKEDYLRIRAEAEKTVVASPDWFQWQHLGGSLGLVTGHSFGDLWKKYGKEHPEWFALQSNGSRDQSSSPDRPRICESNLELRAAIARDRIEELNRNPQQTSVSIDQSDGGRTTFCMCAECKKLDPPEGRKITIYDALRPQQSFSYVSLTDRVVDFCNDVAERVVKVHPDKLLVMRAYSAYLAPPVRRKLHPNLVVEHVSEGYLDDTKTQLSLEDWNQWAAKAPKLVWRPNIYESTRRIGLPVIFVHKMAKDFRARAQNNLISTDIDSALNNWALGGLNVYVMARLNWDPNLDVDAVVDDYCRSGFGPAAGSVRKYFDRIEAATDKMAAGADGSLQAQTKSLVEIYDSNMIDALRADLEEAKQTAGADPGIGRRIEFLRHGLEFTAMQAGAWRLKAQLDANGGKAQDPAAVSRFLAQRATVLRDIFRNDFLAVNVPITLWAVEGGFKTFNRYAPNGLKP